jgi:hypothetical protein
VRRRSASTSSTPRTPPFRGSSPRCSSSAICSCCEPSARSSCR